MPSPIRSDRGLAGPEETRMSQARRTAGTTLIEVLVVIVIFLVGILAVVQIFPKGFGVLVLGRNSSVASALSRDEVERLKSHTDELPYAIVPVLPDGTVDTSLDPNEIGPMGNQLFQTGAMSNSGGSLGNWQLVSGANRFRRVLGESRLVPAPRLVGNAGSGLYYGGLLVLRFGPIVDRGTDSVRVYANDMTSVLGAPESNVRVGDSEYYVQDQNLPSVSVWLPSGDQADLQRYYYISFSAYVQQGTTYVKRDYIALPAVGVIGTAVDAKGNHPPYQVPLASLLPSGTTLGAIDLGSLRVRRTYQLIDTTDTFSPTDPFQYKLLDSQLGVVLMSPYAFGQFIASPAGRVPLQARIDYDVYDWRILRDEFRFPYGLQAQHKLAVTGLKIAGQTGPDGLTNPFMEPVETTPASDPRGGSQAASDFMLVDLDTGGTYVESDNTGLLITVDKSTGLVSVKDLNTSTTGTQAKLRLPDGTVQVVTIDNRAMRALYMARNEFAVQPFKAATYYTQSFGAPGLGEYMVGDPSGNGGLATRIYFPRIDNGRKVTFGVINYRRSGDSTARQMLDQDFVISMPAVPDNVGLPCVDIRLADANASTLDLSSFGYAVRDVKGSSIAVRTIWNPDFFHLGNNSANNMQSLERWQRGYRKAVNETYLELGDVTR